MIRHDESVLWEYASKEMDADERRVMDEHLGDCPDCRERLATVQVAREALEAAREAWPVIDWTKPDAAVGALVEKRLASKARRPWLVKLSLAGAVAAGLVVGAFALARLEPREPVSPKGAGVVSPEPAPSPGARVDSAQGLTRVGVQTAAVEDGAELSSGDVLRTTLAGRAFVHLPDESHVRVAGGTQVALTRAQPDDVALTLERGRVAVRASHAARRGFVVHTGGLSVRVVGTIFSVSNTGEAMEVGVSEGKVRVELPDGDALMVAAGQRVRLDSRSQKPQRLKLTPALARDLSELAEAAEATAAIEKQEVGGSVGGRAPSAPPMVPARGNPRTLPRLSSAEAARRQAVSFAPIGGEGQGGGKTLLAEAPAVTQRLEPATEVVVENPGDTWPSMAGGSLKGVPEAKTASAPDEWAQPPEPQAEEWAPMPPPARAEPAPTEAPAEEWAGLPRPAPAPKPAAAVKKGVAPKDLETLFLQRAEDAIAKADCDKYQLGLEDIAQDADRNARTEQARVLRARCFDVQLRPKQAMNEYRKYLGEYPKGRFVDEAKRALGD
ncbi:MAG: hypothetical protein AMXMBFR34_26650 [Myxococcaceae bacterium]